MPVIKPRFMFGRELIVYMLIAMDIGRIGPESKMYIINQTIYNILCMPLLFF